jgi:hypothetical protein
VTSFSEQVLEALAGLGNTPLDIANTLHNKAVHGLPVSGVECPLAVYIRQQFPELDDTFSVGIYDCGDGHWDLPLTLQQRAFVMEFDQGYYPDLIA